MSGSLSDPGSGLREASESAFASRLAGTCSLIAMAILFFSIVTPVGVLMRVVGRDRLRLRSAPTETSYWVPRISRRRVYTTGPF
jgi:hypothetical protein